MHSCGRSCRLFSGSRDVRHFLSLSESGCTADDVVGVGGLSVFWQADTDVAIRMQASAVRMMAMTTPYWARDAQAL
jgi:hypothetical protein